jgi:hypothetical protein
MKIMVLSFFALVLSFEASAQRRPSGPGRPGPVVTRPAPGPSRPGPVVVRPGPSRPGPVVVGPRYNPNPHSRRVIRTVRRPVIVWDRGFGYACGRFGELLLNGYVVHNFRFSSDCSQALIDIRNYGDFCDNEDLYDQSGRLEAQFTFNYECRNALGWYY